MAKNFLLGFGERLTLPMDAPPRKLDKDVPYTVEESIRRLVPQFEAVQTTINHLPDLACPNNETVVSVILHPAYTAKSYYPQKLFDYLGLRAVGSKGVPVTPEKWTRKSELHDVFSTEIFVSGDRAKIGQLSQLIAQAPSNPMIAQELTKIEGVKTTSAREKIIPLASEKERQTVEVVLQAPANYQRTILRGFGDYLKTVDNELNIDDSIFSKGLCFLALKSDIDLLEQIALFSFVRVIRGMPKLRSFNPLFRATGVNFLVDLPDAEPEDPNLRVAIFDGGFPVDSPLSRWVNLREIGALDDPLPNGVAHGHKVASAFLFGQIEEDGELQRPPAYVDLFRVFDVNDADQSDEEESKNLIRALNRIKDILNSTSYQFVNFSCGPDIPVDDNEVHAWTSVLDECFSDGQTLTTFAAGNTGELDWESGNARLQPPSDCVNGICVGSADRRDSKKKRAKYSSIGPGRLTGFVKPDFVAFGGSSSDLFWFYGHENNGYSCADAGTSFSAPLALRTGVQIRTRFGSNLSPIGIRSLLIHSSQNSGQDKKEIGWGFLPDEVDQIVTTNDSSVRVLYQGRLNPGGWMKIPIPLPDGTLRGMVTIKATLCFATPVDPEDFTNYTRSGLEVVFRPHSGRKKKPEQHYPNTSSFFKSSILHGELDEESRRHDSHRWETVFSATKKMRGTSLNDPEFNVHYIARDGGSNTNYAEPILYSMVVEISALQESNLYNQIFNRFRTHLEILSPRIETEVRV